MFNMYYCNIYMNIESFRTYCLSMPLTTEDMPFDDKVLVFRLKGKIFACINFDNPQIAVLKCDPQKAIYLREHYHSIEGAWHWNKKYWNQIHFNGDVGDTLLKELILHSWCEVNKKLPKKDQTDICDYL